MKNKNHVDFEREFNALKFSFKEIIENNDSLKKAMFQEFIKTTPIPSLILYQDSLGLTKDVIEAGIKLANDAIPLSNGSGMASLVPLYKIDSNGEWQQQPWAKFEDEYWESVRKFENLAFIEKNLDKAFYCYNLKESSTIQVLNTLESELNDMKRSVLINPNAGINREDAIDFATSIGIKLREIEPVLRDKIFKEITNDDSNVDISIHFNFETTGNKTMERYRNLKRVFDLHLREMLNGDVNTAENKTTETPHSKSNTNKAHSPDTIRRHLEYAEFYHRQRKQNKDTIRRALKITRERFNVSEKTIRRAIEENADILGQL